MQKLRDDLLDRSSQIDEIKKMMPEKRPHVRLSWRGRVFRPHHPQSAYIPLTNFKHQIIVPQLG
jgi:hypothetical protein